MRKAMKILAIMVMVAVFFFLFGYFVMRLWNWLMPDLFSLHTITYWQAIGVLVLSKILFGGFRGGRGGGPWGWRRRRMMEQWAKMTPEEREKAREQFRNAFTGRCSF
jgi:H+/Cl- antiporter ClcA